MSDQKQGLPHASKEMEDHVREVFPIDISPEEFAARDGDGWLDFAFNDFRFSDPELDSWIHAVGKIIRDPQTLREVQEQYLTPAELIEHDNIEKSDIEEDDGR